nr:MAG TPA: hypothetical protein [Caudoviricetes sp.]
MGTKDIGYLFFLYYYVIYNIYFHSARRGWIILIQYTYLVYANE